MPSTTLTRVRNTIDAAGIQVATFARVSDIPQTSLSAAFGDKMHFSGPREAELLTLATKCARIVEAIKPFALDRNGVLAAETLKFLLAKSPEEITSQISVIFQQNE